MLTPVSQVLLCVFTVFLLFIMVYYSNLLLNITGILQVYYRYITDVSVIM